MTRTRCLFSIVAFLTLASLACAQTDGARIDGLVRKLGSASFVQREQARKELEAVGPSALDALKRAAKTAEPETARRIGDLVTRFEEQLLTKQVLTPKMIDLKLDGVTVQEAISDIAKQSGYAMQFQGDATPFAGKKIKLNGKMPFWEAVDNLCQQGGLIEQVSVAPQYFSNPYSGRIMRRPIVLPQNQPGPAGPIILTAGGSSKRLVSHAGSVKTELSLVGGGAKQAEWQVALHVSTEPGLINSHVTGRPVIAKIVDERGRAMKPMFDFPSVASPTTEAARILELENAQPTRIVKVRIKDDADAARSIRELSGSLSLQLDLQNVQLARIENVMEAAKPGGSSGILRVHSVKKMPYAFELQIAIDYPQANPFGNVFINGGNVIIRGNVNGGIVINGGNVRINGGGNLKDLPELLDADGRKFVISSIANDSVNFANGSSSRTATILYQAPTDHSEPRNLVLYGTRTHTITVPFRFENVPLP